MGWKDKNAAAISAMMDGDEAKACTIWEEAVSSVGQEQPSVELGQMYHFYAKTLCSQGDYESALPWFRQAERTIFECEPGHASFKQVKYDIGQTLAKLGRSDEAVADYKMAMGMVSRPEPECLKGKKTEYPGLKASIKTFQKLGLLSELLPSELELIHEVLCEEGKADINDLESIHPFDLLYEYYYEQPHRQVSDKAIFDPAEINEFAPQLIDKLGFALFSPADFVTVQANDDDSKKLFLIIDREASKAVALHRSDWEDLIQVFNYALRMANDSRRFLRLGSYDDREGVILLELSAARALYLAGINNDFFEDIFSDVEPSSPVLVSSANF